MHDTNLTIRQTEQADSTSLETLYREAFTEEDLLPLITELLNDRQNTLHLSALKNGHLVGHIALTRCNASPDTIPLSLLGPMAVMPDCQRQGIGGSLIKEGFNLLKGDSVAKVLVLGDPNFYGRTGFVVEHDIKPAYAIPKHYETGWQSILLSDSPISVSGRLNVTKPWQREDLWSE